MQQVWFITGSSRGLGRALAGAALDAGDSVVATARQPGQPSAEFAERYADRVLPLALDVTDAGAVRDAVAAGAGRFGRLDVVVNNAGYANVAPVETGDEADFRTQFETNFWGVYNVSRAVISQLRAQGGGIIVQFSSVGGRVGGSPGIASYQAAKFAVDGFSRVLAVETAPFGIRVMVVEPSGFATDWAGSSMTVHEIPAGLRRHDRRDGPANAPQLRPLRPAWRPAWERAAEIIVNTVKPATTRPTRPAARRERRREMALPLLPAAARRGHRVGRRQPVCRLRRAVSRRVPARHARELSHHGCRPANGDPDPAPELTGTMFRIL